jgi:polyisoprenoid-binding protein YceI
MIPMKTCALCFISLVCAATGLPAFGAEVPAGHYVLDPAHSSLIFRIDHLGFSMFTARFTRFDAEIEFDPNSLAKSRLTATVDADSLETDYPDPATLDFNAMLRGSDWLDTAEFPEMTFRGERTEVGADGSMRIHGQLTLHGVTRPFTLTATYNGGYAGHPMEPRARIGFSARGALERSAFGITTGIPQPGSKMGVGDRVEIVLETEFTGPAWHE